MNIVHLVIDFLCFGQGSLNKEQRDHQHHDEDAESQEQSQWYGEPPLSHYS
jgi:hypothetical protein